MFRSSCIGIVVALLGIFPVAALVALIYRFPIPAVGYLSGLDGMMGSPLAVLLYGIVGGFYLLAVFGAIAGAVAHAIASRLNRARIPMIVGFALIPDVVAAILLAVLKL